MKKFFYLISLFALLSVLTSCNKKEIESRQPLSDEDSVLYLIDYCSTFDKSIIPSVIVGKWYPYCEVSKSEMQDERLNFPLLFGEPWPGKGTADYTFSNDKTCFTITLPMSDQMKSITPKSSNGCMTNSIVS